MRRTRLSRFLFHLYRIESRILRDRILSIAVRTEKGEAFSTTLRDIFEHYYRIKIGMYSYGGCFDTQNIPAGTAIGRYCSFARNVYLLNGNHPMKQKSLHPFFYNPIFGYVGNLLITRTNFLIGNDVWVGQNVTILPSVTRIGDGAVIGAGSVVTQDAPPFAVMVGNPARIIKYRFTPETIEKILQLKWWEKDIDQLKGDEFEFTSFLKPLE
jgi:virginiamycin A acetyltransferase